MHNDNTPVMIRGGRSMLAAFGNYVEACEESGTFPNLAGFCRYCRIGEEGLAKLSRRYPGAYDFIITALEDEALNADKSASLVTAYLKRRLGYGEAAADEGQTILIDRALNADGE
ncbi:MAG: hypothetical protein IJX53_06860 [Clostridia bacterium]|nr:hypothetical protein [Clostridia bacterium]